MQAKEMRMKALHPWLRGIAVGAGAGWLSIAAGIGDAGTVAIAATVLACIKFTADQRTFEQQLFNQELWCLMDVEQAFARVQRAMANVWLNDAHWFLVAADLATGYMLYRYEWREEDSQLHDGRLRHHANLEIECTDAADPELPRTVLKLKFDGFPNWMNKAIFYDAVIAAVDSIDYFIQQPQQD
jgi:hypothetical protein